MKKKMKILNEILAKTRNERIHLQCLSKKQNIYNKIYIVMCRSVFCKI